MSYADESPRSDSNKTLIIILAIAVVVLAVIAACGGLIYFAVNAAKEAMKPAMEMIEDMQRAPSVADSFLADIRANRLQAAYQSTTTAFQARMSQAEFEKLVKKHPALQQQAESQGMDVDQNGK